MEKEYEALFLLSFIALFSFIQSILLFAIHGYVRAMKNKKQQQNNSDRPAKFYITGDKHRNFHEVQHFCRNMNTQRKDVLIILGDSGLNYYLDTRDDALKKAVSKMDITLFCVYGNKECRAENIDTYGVRNFYGGKVFYQPAYPNIVFAKDGEVYVFEGKRYIVVGGAHSVDRLRCIENHLPFWDDEMPTAAIRERVEATLAAENNDIYGILTHTCPEKYLPTEMFLSTRQKSKRKPLLWRSKKRSLPLDIDHSTEN